MPCAVIGNIKGEKGDPGRDADPVVGIKSINNTRNDGLHHYYRITLTDDTYFDFVVTDGADGVVDLTTDTPSQVLNKLKNVDGSGSGLDADLLDGKDSSFFATKDDVENRIQYTTEYVHSAFRFAKSGNTVTLVVEPWSVNKPQTEEWVSTDLSVPVGYEPPYHVFVANVFRDDVRLRITPTGDIKVWVAAGATKHFMGNAAWIIPGGEND